MRNMPVLLNCMKESVIADRTPQVNQEYLFRTVQEMSEGALNVIPLSLWLAGSMIVFYAFLIIHTQLEDTVYAVM